MISMKGWDCRVINKAMERKLDSGEALNVREEGTPLLTCPDTVGFPCHFQLRRFVEGKDYCDRESERWIWSIGRERSTGVIIASTIADMYQNADYECLFLR